MTKTAVSHLPFTHVRKILAQKKIKKVPGDGVAPKVTPGVALPVEEVTPAPPTPELREHDEIFTTEEEDMDLTTVTVEEPTFQFDDPPPTPELVEPPVVVQTPQPKPKLQPASKSQQSKPKPKPKTPVEKLEAKREKRAAKSLRRLKKLINKSNDITKLFKSAVFKRIFKQILGDYNPELRLSRNAFDLLLEAIFAWIMQVLQAGSLARVHGKRLTLMSLDLQFVEELKLLFNIF